MMDSVTSALLTATMSRKSLRFEAYLSFYEKADSLAITPSSSHDEEITLLIDSDHIFLY
jgi:hypothetical protein